MPEVAIQWIGLLLHIQKVPSSNPEIDILSCCVSPRKYLNKMSYYNTTTSFYVLFYSLFAIIPKLDYNVVAHAQKIIFVYGLNGRVHLLLQQI
jgi:hypothetical protein